MRCVFCAEEIKDAAVLCRFCGAEKTNGQWFRASRPKGSFTIKSAGYLLALSGLFSLLSVASDVPLFGAMRAGAVAITYNVLFAGFYFGMAAGLVAARPWGFRLFLVGTVVYSLDKALFLLDAGARGAYLSASGVTKEVATLIDVSFLDQAIVLTTVACLACWWGFAVYVYLRRGYFVSANRRLEIDPGSTTATTTTVCTR